jgi:hypothetical protein
MGLGSSLSTHRRRALAHKAAAELHIKRVEKALKKHDCRNAVAALTEAGVSAGLTFAHDDSRSRAKRRGFYKNAAVKKFTAAKKRVMKACKFSSNKRGK